MASLRPRNLDELLQKEVLDIESLSSTFSLDDISNDEDIWIMDIPKSINPQELQGRKITLGDKVKIKIKDQRYRAINRNVSSDIICVFSTEKAAAKYKTVNVKTAGLLTIRKKFSEATQMKPLNLENHAVPFPSNLKRKHPLFDVSNNNKLRKISKKHHSSKKKSK